VEAIVSGYNCVGIWKAKQGNHQRREVSGGVGIVAKELGKKPQAREDRSKEEAVDDLKVRWP
jgi:hypothetical protein